VDIRKDGLLIDDLKDLKEDLKSNTCANLSIGIAEKVKEYLLARGSKD
jgi:hypothetical protein